MISVITEVDTNSILNDLVTVEELTHWLSGHLNVILDA